MNWIEAAVWIVGIICASSTAIAVATSFAGRGKK